MKLDEENAVVNSLSSSANTSSQLPLKSPGYTTFFVILTLLAFAAVLLNILTIAALVRDSTILKTVRVLLINIFVAELLISIAVIIDAISSAVLSARRANPTTPPHQFCRFVNWLLAVSVIARIYGLMAYITTLVVYIRCGWKRFKALYMVAALVALWMLAAVLGADRWIPQSVGATYLKGVACSSVADENVILSVRITFGTLWILLGGIIPLFICSSLTVVGICQLRQYHRLDSTASAQYKISVAKLASFLIIGNLVNLLCVCLPSLGSIISSFPQAKVNSVAVVTIFLFALSVSLYPTHIIVMICMQTVRQQMIVIICHCQPCRHLSKAVTDELEMKATTLLVVDTADKCSHV